MRDCSGRQVVLEVSEVHKKEIASPAGVKPVLLTGDSPRISQKGWGHAPVHAYIAAMPGWKSELGRRFDALILRNEPNVRIAEISNLPFYGNEILG